MSETAEIRLKWTVESNVERETDKITAAMVRASKADEEYLKRLEGRKRAMAEEVRMKRDLERSGFGPRYGKEPETGPSFERRVSQAEEAFREREAMTRALQDRGIGVPKGPKSIGEEVRERMARADREERIQERLKARGYGAEEKGAAAAASDLLIGMGPAAAAIYAAKAGSEYAVASGKIAADPWMTAHQKHLARFESIPIAGFAFQQTRDLARYQFSEQGQQYQQAVRAGSEGEIQGRFRGQVYGAEERQALDEKILHQRAGIFQGLRLDRPTGYDRGDVLGARLQREEMSLLPIRQQQNIAAKERLFAEQKALTIEREEGLALQHRDSLQKQMNALVGQRKELGADTHNDRIGQLQQIVAREQQLRPELEAAGKTYEDLVRRRVDARQEATAARDRERQLNVEGAERRYAIAQEREARVTSQAERLGGMGIEGRMRGDLSYQLLKQIGIENAPSQLIGDAASIAPETVLKMQRDFGEKLLPGYQRGVSDKEYDQTSIADARRTTDQAYEARTEAMQSAAVTSAAEAAQAVRDFLAPFVAEMKRQMETFKQDVDRDAFLRNQAAH